LEKMCISGEIFLYHALVQAESASAFSAHRPSAAARTPGSSRSRQGSPVCRASHHVQANAHAQCRRPSFPMPARSHPKLTAPVCVPAVPLRPCRRCAVHAVPIPTGFAIVPSPTCLVLIHSALRARYIPFPNLGRRSALPRSARATDASATRHCAAAERWPSSTGPPPAARPGSPPPQHWRPT
jgi:hypothetical protein